jgi:dienelactone hydrolase
MSTGLIFQLLCALLPAAALTGCSDEEPFAAPAAIEWHTVATPVGNVSVAVVRPENEGGEPHPVVFGLPWGSGTTDLVEGFIQSYWLTEPAARDYYVVVPSILGSSLEEDANDVLPALFDWMQSELSMDADQVALVGASNGGRGLFFSAVAQPDRFRALMGMPAMYRGDPANLSVLVGKPVWLMVGEFDDGWRTGTDATVLALESHGITPVVDVVASQGHVMSLDAVQLMDWIDEALGR